MRPALNPRTAARLLAVALLPALGACAMGEPPRPIASMTLVELVGLTVESRDGAHVLGTVDDILLTPANRPAQVVVSSGAPVYPETRLVTLDSDDFRYSTPRQALVLTGMSADRFAELPGRVGNGGFAPAGQGGTTVGTPSGATNWRGATVRP